MNDHLFLLINSWAGHSSILDVVMVFCAQWLIYGLGTAALVCLGILMFQKQWRPILFFFVGLVVSYITLKLMALLNFDHRPFMDHHVTQLIAHAPGKSFPSDHTSASVAIAAGILLLTRFKKAGFVLLAVALLIGFSRIFVGVHYPADIIGGVITGFVGVGIVYGVMRITAPKNKPVAFDAE